MGDTSIPLLRLKGFSSLGLSPRALLLGNLVLFQGLLSRPAILGDWSDADFGFV